MHGPVRQRYESMVESGDIAPDASQRALADRLDALARGIASKHLKPKRRTLGWLARGGVASAVRGVYIWGSVGRGKTLLMDLFFAAAPTDAKRRVHFHEFMSEVHDRLQASRRTPKRRQDPLAAVAAAIASEIDLLCFDEFAVFDIADAMILGRFSEQLFAHGVTIVATSNFPPQDLYKDGLNRALFLPFIALIKERMTVVRLSAPRDYRLGGAGTARRYVTPLDGEAEACLQAHFQRLTGRRRGAAAEIAHRGRVIRVRESAGGVARFDFEELCAQPLGAGDYRRIAEAFHTIIIAGVPRLDARRRNEAKRLINLLDTLYDKHVRIVVSAAAEPEALWLGADGSESLEFSRASSRLIEMRSDGYWEAATQKKKARAV